MLFLATPLSVVSQSWDTMNLLLPVPKSSHVNLNLPFCLNELSGVSAVRSPAASVTLLESDVVTLVIVAMLGLSRTNRFTVSMSDKMKSFWVRVLPATVLVSFWKVRLVFIVSYRVLAASVV